MKTKDAIAIRCNCCQRNLPAAEFYVQRNREKGWQWRVQPCKACRSLSNPHRGSRLSLVRVRGWRSLPEAECFVCHSVKPVSEFYASTKGRECKDCCRAGAVRRRALAPPETRAADRERLEAWKASHPKEVHLSHSIAKAKKRAAGVVAPYRMPMTSRSGRLTVPQWEALVEAFGGCAYCGATGEMQVEHVVPVSRGGTHTADNIVPACPRCNNRKNAHDLRTWLADEDRYQFVCDMRSLSQGV